MHCVISCRYIMITEEQGYLFYNLQQQVFCLKYPEGIPILPQKLIIIAAMFQVLRCQPLFGGIIKIDKNLFEKRLSLSRQPFFIPLSRIKLPTVMHHTMKVVNSSP